MGHKIYFITFFASAGAAGFETGFDKRVFCQQVKAVYIFSQPHTGGGGVCWKISTHFAYWRIGLFETLLDLLLPSLACCMADIEKKGHFGDGRSDVGLKWRGGGEWEYELKEEEGVYESDVSCARTGGLAAKSEVGL